MKYGIITAVLIGILAISILGVAIPVIITEGASKFTVTDKNTSNFDIYDKSTQIKSDLDRISDNSENTELNPNDNGFFDQTGAFYRSAQKSYVIVKGSGDIARGMTTDIVRETQIDGIGSHLAEVIPLMIFVLITVTYAVSAFIKWRS